MKLFGGLTLVAGLASAACPTGWTDPTGSGSCEPGTGFSFICNDDGTVSIEADMEHFFDAMPADLAANVATLIVAAGWTHENNDYFSITDDLTMSQTSSTEITGTYTVAGQQTWAQRTLGTGNEVIDVARALSFDITCTYDTEFSINVGNVGIAASETFDGYSDSNTNTLVTAELQDNAGSTASTWVLGETVNVVFTGPTWAFLTVKDCVAYSENSYTNNPITITYGECVQEAVGASVTADSTYSKLTTGISFEAFKYNANDETAYLQCNVLIGLENDSGLASAALDSDFDGAVDTINTAGGTVESNALTC
ncbi:Oidioi.mRNA.OKI2018_I69.chr1.g3192.t1.cds [Oikopleura dioica]|uniref:Oidioi.mRNA.OKI2018_I69.chr1.g3192.t1.cds n=1 Tax=Oikopleura dioica TaxID=34765 RepID=A0ABN7SWX6_OIKDI|nr:Oidioi.mRNA.OKI2018_I69.chr1.g3192.t1.cds [Oikopleura dioica]